MNGRRDFAQVMQLRSIDGVEAALKAGSSAGVEVMVISGSPESISLKAAKALDITIPRALLLRADEVIQ